VSKDKGSSKISLNFFSGLSTKNEKTCTKGAINAIEESRRLCTYKGIKALRISTLYDGTNRKSGFAVPSNDIFTKNHIKGQKISNISLDRIKGCFKYNCYGFE